MATSWLAPFWSHPVGARLAYYPTLLFGIFKTNSKRRWYDRIDDKVILGALPFHKTAKELILKENVSRVITLNEAYETRFLCPNTRQWAQMNVEQLCIPTVDYNNAPTLFQIQRSINFIQTSRPGSIYVHCKAGRSRSATVVLCYLIVTYKFDPEEAINFLKSKRPHIILGESHMKRVNDFYFDGLKNCDIIKE